MGIVILAVVFGVYSANNSSSELAPDCTAQDFVVTGGMWLSSNYMGKNVYNKAWLDARLMTIDTQEFVGLPSAIHRRGLGASVDQWLPSNRPPVH